MITASVGSEPASIRQRSKINATRMTFVLALFCLSILGYAAIEYLQLSFVQTREASSVPLALLQQRTGLSALAMAVAISCVVMGFAVFMIEAKGEVNFKADNTVVKGALSSTVPGPFFVLCGTIITVSVLFARASYEQGTSSQPADKQATTGAAAVPQGPTGSVQSTPASRTETENAATTVTVSRTIASAPNTRSALFTRNTAIFNDLMAIALEDNAKDDLKHLIDNEDDISVVVIDWDEAKRRPMTFAAHELANQQAKVNGLDGYLFVLQGRWAETTKQLLQAANGVNANPPSAGRIDDRDIVRIIKTALNGKVVFSHGDSAH
jgi:hypothetical protein